MPKTFIHPINREIGRRVKLRRKQRGLSQAKLGAAIGTAPQQVQKYEVGQNHLNTSRLIFVAEALDVPLSYFFDGLEYSQNKGHNPVNERMEGLFVIDPELIDLCEAVLRLPDERARGRAIRLARGVVALLENDESLR